MLFHLVQRRQPRGLRAHRLGGGLRGGRLRRRRRLRLRRGRTPHGERLRDGELAQRHAAVGVVGGEQDDVRSRVDVHQPPVLVRHGQRAAAGHHLERARHGARGKQRLERRETGKTGKTLSFGGFAVSDRSARAASRVPAAAGLVGRAAEPAERVGPRADGERANGLREEGQRGGHAPEVAHQAREHLREVGQVQQLRHSVRAPRFQCSGARPASPLVERLRAPRGRLPAGRVRAEGEHRRHREPPLQQRQRDEV